jgi:hypothetical protein
MSIDKHSSGMPEVNPHRRTTKVNFSIIGGVILFFIAMGIVMLWLSRH